MKTKLMTIFVIFIVFITLVIGVIIGRKTSTKKVKVIKSQQYYEDYAELWSAIEDNGKVSYYNLYKFTLHCDYFALKYLEEGDYESAKTTLRHTIRVKASFPEIWPLHCKYEYPLPKNLKRLTRDNISLFYEDNKREYITNKLELMSVYLLRNEFEKAYLELQKCIDYERKHRLVPKDESGLDSCVKGRESVIRKIVTGDCCGFLNLMHSKHITLEQKKELINELEKAILRIEACKKVESETNK